MWTKYKNLWKQAGTNSAAVFAKPAAGQSKLNILGAKALWLCAVISIFFIIGLLLFPLDAKGAKEIVADNKKPSWFEIIIAALFAAPFGAIASVVFILAKFAK